MTDIPKLLTIAGSDPSGGAGVQGDLKTFAAFGGYGMAVVTALTAQNTHGVTGVWPVSAEMVSAQITAVINDLEPDAIKIGMVATAANARAIANSIRSLNCPVVLDPVLVPTQGVSLAESGLEAVLTGELLSLASLVTPNIFEAAALTGIAPASTVREMASQGRALIARGARAVLIKGGDLAGDPVDVLVTGGETRHFPGRRVVTRNTHGTGCALSSAITSELAKGTPLIEAIARAKNWLETALDSADMLASALRVGSGRGPLHHLFSPGRGTGSQNLL